MFVDVPKVSQLGGSVFAAVDLHLLPGLETQAVELFGRQVPQLCHEALDRVVLASSRVGSHQVIVGGSGVALDAQKRLDELVVGLAQRGGRRHRNRWDWFLALRDIV